MKFSFMVNPHRADAVAKARATAQALTKLGHEVAGDVEGANSIGVEQVPNASFAHCDLAVTFGGDGTLIRAAHLCAKEGTPILGVFYGRFGFVTQCNPEDVETSLEDFLAGRTDYEERMMLDAELVRNGEGVATLHALNEIVLQRSINDRMLTFDVRVDGEDLTSYPADGVLVSTPTGSTAYNLSAGGPVMAPEIQAMSLTAIAPHTLSARTLLVGPSSTIEIGLQSPGDAVISSDGLTKLHWVMGDRVRIRKSEMKTKLVKTRNSDFLEKLRNRLFWSKGMVDVE